MAKAVKGTRLMVLLTQSDLKTGKECVHMVNLSTPEQAVRAIRKSITIVSQFDPNTKTPMYLIRQTA